MDARRQQGIIDRSDEIEAELMRLEKRRRKGK